MAKCKKDAIDMASFCIRSIEGYNKIKGVLLWGSILDLDDDQLIESDVDMLVLTDNIKEFYVGNSRILFGVPTKKIKYADILFDVFFVDKFYLSDAIKCGHWTVVNALKRGIRIIDHSSFNELRDEAETFAPFSLRGSQDWLNQAIQLYTKSKIEFERCDYRHSIILAREAAQTALYAFVYQVMGRPASPRSLLKDATYARGTEDFVTQLFEIHDLKEASRNQAVAVLMACANMMANVSSTIILEERK